MVFTVFLAVFTQKYVQTSDKRSEEDGKACWYEQAVMRNQIHAQQNPWPRIGSSQRVHTIYIILYIFLFTFVPLMYYHYMWITALRTQFSEKYLKNPKIFHLLHNKKVFFNPFSKLHHFFLIQINIVARNYISPCFKCTAWTFYYQLRILVYIFLSNMLYFHTNMFLLLLEFWNERKDICSFLLPG